MSSNIPWNPQTILKFIFFMSIAGLLVSAYLTYAHYVGHTTLCSADPGAGCSAVNTSVYSVIAGIPVGILGIIWFVVLGTLSWKSLHTKAWIKGLPYWNGLGLLFVVYFIWAEYQLQEICAFCTLVHIFVVLSFSCTLVLLHTPYAKKK